MPISGLKGLRNKILSASDFFWLAIKTLQWLQLCFLRRPYSMALTRDALVVMYSHPGLTRKITNFLRGTGMKPKNEKTKKVIDTGYDAQSPSQQASTSMRGTCTWLTSRWLISKSHNADTQSHFLAWSATGIPRKSKSLMQCFNISYEQIVCSHCSYFSSPLQSKGKYCTARKILASIISKTFG